MRSYVVMGVSGCGKSTVGSALAERIGASFVDGDELHPQHNIDKMSRGEPLNDDDRHPWLEKVGQTIQASETPIIIGCSALKRIYRNTIRDSAGKPVQFLHLAGSRAVLEDRMKQRTGHFMPATLLDSQLATLEAPDAREYALTVDIDKPLEALVDELAALIEGNNT